MRSGQGELVVNASTPVMTIGRIPPCDLVIPQACVSSQHGRVEYQEGRIIFVDHGSGVTASPAGPASPAQGRHPSAEKFKKGVDRLLGI
jgi:pSer/pThr/pTyr-binding forkhead associated (FHA) protein